MQVRWCIIWLTVLHPLSCGCGSGFCNWICICINVIWTWWNYREWEGVRYILRNNHVLLLSVACKNPGMLQWIIGRVGVVWKWVCKSIQDMWFEDDVANFLVDGNHTKIVNSVFRCDDASYGPLYHMLWVADVVLVFVLGFEYASR